MAAKEFIVQSMLYRVVCSVEIAGIFTAGYIGITDARKTFYGVV